MWKTIQYVFQSKVVQENSVESPPNPEVFMFIVATKPETDFMHEFYVGAIQYERDRFVRRQGELANHTPNSVYGSFVPFSA